MRVIVRKERRHPGAQLRITGIDGMRVAFARNTATVGYAGQGSTRLVKLDLRQHRRARCEDRIRVAKDTGLTNLPLHWFDQNRICRDRVPGARDHRLNADAGPVPG